MTLYVETIGEGQDIVLLHGWGFNSAVWHSVAEVLTSEYRVTLIDLPGFGRSAEEKSTYDIDALIELLIPVIPKDAFLLGWSMGGLIAQGIALKYPAHLKKLILLGSNAQFMASDAWPHAMRPAVLEGFIDELIKNFNRTLQVFLMLQAQNGEHARETIRQLKSQLYLHGDPDESALRGGLLLLKNTSFIDRLLEISVPTYLMAGARDTMVPLAACKKMKEQIPDAELFVFEHAAHAPFISHYDEFMKILKKEILK